MLFNLNIKQLVYFPVTSKLIVLFMGVTLFVALGTILLPLKMLIIIFVLPLFVCFLLFAFKQFDRAVLVAIFFAPLLPVSIGFKPFDFLPLITGQRIILLSLYLVFIFRGLFQKIKLPHLSLFTQLILLLYIGSSILTSFFSIVPLQSFYRVFANLFDNIGLFIIIASAAARQDGRLFARRALLSLWLSFTTLAILGLIEVATGFNILHYIPDAEGEVLATVYRLDMRRGQGLLPNPTALGIVIALGIVLTMLFITRQKKSIRRKWLWLIWIINLIALMGTLTRTAWAVALAGIVIWLFFARKNRMQLMLIIFIVLGALIVLGVEGKLYSIILDGMNISQQTETSTLFSRIQWIDIVWTNLNVNKTRLWLGFGFGSVEQLTEQWTMAGFHAQMTSDYLIRLAEGGILGLLSFIGILFAGIIQCRPLIRSADPQVHTIGIFFITAFIQMAFSSLTLPIFVWAQTAYLFWIFWSILVTIYLPENVHNRKKRLVFRLTPVRF